MQVLQLSVQNQMKMYKTSHIHSNLRMWFLSLDMAATASSCVTNSTSASPVALPSAPMSI